MKWLKMDCDAQENLDMRKLVDDWGWEWYGRWWAICGKVGMLVTENRQTFALQTNNGCPFPIKLLANDLSTTVERLEDFCKYLADNRLIDTNAWYDKKLIFIPKLRDRADEYTRKLLTKSRHSPDQEEEVEEEKKKKKNISLEQKNIPSSIEEAIEYFLTLGANKETAEDFYDHFQSNGWKVSGKTPMKDWRAAARRWKRQSDKYSQKKSINGISTKQHQDKPGKYAGIIKH